MRIGEFSRNNNVSKDAVRHYMDMGLILPQKHGGQYKFDDKCVENLREILQLKEMGFSLNEIKTVFLFRMLGKLTHYQQDEYYRAIFVDKYESILKEIEELNKTKEKLEVKIRSFKESQNDRTYSMGIDISLIGKFKCSKCGKNLSICDGEIRDNQLLFGKLKCGCDMAYTIDDGILMVGSNHYDSKFGFDYNYIAEYINVTDYDYLDNVYKGLSWIQNEIDFGELQNKTVLEIGSGVGFALRSIYENLSDDTVYLAVDHDLSRHKFLKSMLERAEVKKKILFICSDFLEIPIEKKSVDFLLDFSGTSNYSFDNEDFLLEKVDSYLKDHGRILGSYILFNNFGWDSYIEQRFRKNFKLEHIKNKIDELQFKKINDKVSKYVENGGKYEDYFVKGEKVYNYIYHGER